ncbi:MAG: YebC/PmpR family DNA-binding transcriptional regulator [Planctomycetota bacterium]
MSGHSHWARIKRKKGATDVKKGKLFSKLARQVIMAARGGRDPDHNIALRYALDAAREASMPRDSIDRAVEKGAGGGAGTEFESVVYEGYGPGGVAISVEALTDNRNRTSGEVRGIFEEHGGNLGATGCVGWLFEKKGVINVPATGTTEDKLLEIAIDLGAENIERIEDEFAVTVAPESFEKMRQALAKAGHKPASAAVQKIPKSTVAVAGDDARRILALLSKLEEHDDVSDVAANSEIPDELLNET